MTMNRKAGLYAVIGGVVGAVLTMAVCSVMPIGAQNGDATFGEITCTGLRVVDAGGDGLAGVIMGVNKNGGMVQVRGKGSTAAVQVGIKEHGGAVAVYGKGSDKSRAIMSVNEYGNGGVSAWDKNGYRLE